MALWHYATAVIAAQRGHLFPWVPVFLAAGVGIYFSLPAEPSAGKYALLAVTALVLWVFSRRVSEALSPLFIAAALVAAGVNLAGGRAHHMAAPVLEWRYYGPVEGRIVEMDRSGSDALRLTLDNVVLRNVSPERTPQRVRISLHGRQGFITPSPSMTVMTTAHLSPPGGPVEPGGFDFQRHAWFKGLGAVGYTRNPLLSLEPPDGKQPVFTARRAISARVQVALPGETGAFAAAIMTGDRSGIAQETLEALRISNLAHLLAISGLHMGLLAGVVFAALRILLAAIPPVGLRVAGKKIAALGALVVAAGYLALSGGNVATERAFVMVAVVLGAVLLDRRAFSLRAVAVAAIIVLILRPEALLGPGFQMSFAATTGLVAVFGWLRDRRIPLGPGWLRPAVAVVISSFVAGAATAPVAAAHFNQIAHFGLVANLLSVPLMGVLVMPAALTAAALLPLGLHAFPLWVMGLGLRWILWVADWVSGLEGARGTVPSPEPPVLPLLAAGALMLVLWQGRARLAGLVPAAAAIWLWSGTERPEILIADTGALVGVMTVEGRALSKPRGAGFVAANWLENDGDPAVQEDAAALWPAVSKSGVKVRALRGKRAARDFTGCDGAAWVVMNAVPPEGELPPDLECRVLHPGLLRKTGALALHAGPEGRLRAITAREVTGARLWNTPAARTSQ